MRIASAAAMPKVCSRRGATCMHASQSLWLRPTKGAYGDFWYPDVKAGAQGIKWIEKCVESADKGSAWVDYE